ncbi:hypothetical protein DQ04_16771000 [Trypanosoma grayi]|uniref:hypothetical protein n=1 Tax=Trypanosoma grayi TaxID=71804 RepID=UPI0004F4574D|nr:hypothetical protein DQ04_16771000 [Trypanosoma grayi]KEG05992.1 hypothetical protein DQ04_16771000 [Trypanosoma grayi]
MLFLCVIGAWLQIATVAYKREGGGNQWRCEQEKRRAHIRGRSRSGEGNTAGPQSAAVCVCVWVLVGRRVTGGADTHRRSVAFNATVTSWSLPQLATRSNPAAGGGDTPHAQAGSSSTTATCEEQQQQQQQGGEIENGIMTTQHAERKSTRPHAAKRRHLTPERHTTPNQASLHKDKTFTHISTHVAVRHAMKAQLLK